MMNEMEEKKLNMNELARTAGVHNSDKRYACTA